MLWEERCQQDIVQAVRDPVLHVSHSDQFWEPARDPEVQPHTSQPVFLYLGAGVLCVALGSSWGGQGSPVSTPAPWMNSQSGHVFGYL